MIRLLQLILQWFIFCKYELLIAYNYYYFKIMYFCTV